MVVTEERKKKLNDIAIGLVVNSQISIPDQIAALREQIDLILAANPKITIGDNYKALTTVVATEKAKKKDATKNDTVIDGR
jgi:hypothetical protein